MPSTPNEQLEVHLLATAGLVRRAYDRHLAPLELNITESGLLQFLKLGQPMSQTEMARRLHIGRMSAGTVVKALVQRGLVERERDPDDGRAWLIRLTTSGDAVAARCAEVDREVSRELRTGLDRDGHDALRRLLDTIRQNADRLNEAPE